MTENSSTVLVGEIHLHCAGFWTWKSSPSHRLLFHFSLLLSGGTPQAIVWWFTNEPPVVRCACGCEPHQCAAERGGGHTSPETPARLARVQESNAPPITAAPPTASEPDRPSPLGMAHSIPEDNRDKEQERKKGTAHASDCLRFLTDCF